MALVFQVFAPERLTEEKLNQIFAERQGCGVDCHALMTVPAPLPALPSAH